MAPATWLAPTMKDYLRTATEEKRAELIVQEYAEDNHLVRCPGCGRFVTADMLLDVRPLPATARAKVRHEHDWACDACRETWFRERRATRREVFQHLGAPAHVLTRIDKFAIAAGEIPVRGNPNG
jgi:hypothetical protein